MAISRRLIGGLRLSDVQLDGDIRVAEPVEAPDLNQAFGHVEDLCCRVRWFDLSRPHASVAQEAPF